VLQLQQVAVSQQQWSAGLWEQLATVLLLLETAPLETGAPEPPLLTGGSSVHCGVNTAHQLLGRLTQKLLVQQLLAVWSAEALTVWREHALVTWQGAEVAFWRESHDGSAADAASQRSQRAGLLQAGCWAMLQPAVNWRLPAGNSHCSLMASLCS